MKFGAHVSAAGGIFNAPGNAAKIGCEVFQVFSRPPQGGPAPKLTPSIIEHFKAEVKKHKFTEYYIHTPYFINFASTKPPIRYGSIKIVREELERGSQLGFKYITTHLGSTKDAGPKLGFHKTWRAIQRVLDGYTGSCQLTLEISAGAGSSTGGSFEELASLIKHAETKKPYRGKIGVCLDTCHLFAAGYDIRTPAAVQATVKQIDKTFGLPRLTFFHGNDSKAGLGEHKDRHEHIGKGKIGLAGFRAIVNHPKLKKINMALETPWDDQLPKDITTLKRLRT